MKIDANPNRCTVTCPASKATAAILKEIGGWKFDGREWTFPLPRLPELRKLFPYAQLTETAQSWFVPKSAIRIEAARAVCERLNAVGLSVIERYGRVCVVMVNGVELPPTKTETPFSEYDTELRSLLATGEDFTVNNYGNLIAKSAVAASPVDDLDNSLEAKMLRGWKTAAEVEKRKVAMIKRRYQQSRREDKQMELI